MLVTIFSLIFMLIFYGVGYYGGCKVLSKIHLKSTKAKRSISYVNKILKKHGNLSILIARMIPFSRTYVSLLAGVYKFDLYSYIFYSFFGIFIWNAIIVSLGFSLFINLDYISYFYQNCKILILIIISVSIILLLRWKNNSKKR